MSPATATLPEPSDATAAPYDGEFFVRWDPTYLAIDHSLRVKVDGDDLEALFAIDGVAQGSLSPDDHGGAIPAKLQLATDALRELAASGGGERPTRVPCGKGVFVLTAPDLTSHSMFQRPRNIAHGEFELNVLRPGDEDDLFLRGWMEQLDAYDERVGHAVRTAQELAAELRRERVRGGSVGRHRPAAGMTRACVTR